MSQLKIKDGNSWINIPAGGIGVPSGGTAGQVLTKSSSTDYATEWATLEHTTIIGRKGTTGSVASSGTIVSISVPAGTYQITGYIDGGDGAVAWLAINGTFVSDNTNPNYARIQRESCYSNIITFSETTTISFQNQTGSAKEYFGACNIIAIKL